MAVKTQKAYMVSVPPRSAGYEFHAAIAALDEPHDEVALMAGSMDFVTPREICGLRALVDHAAAHTREVVLACPNNRHVHRYLERVDFYEHLPPNVRLNQPRPRVRRRDQQDQLIELTRIGSTDDVEGLMDRVSKVAKRQVGPGHLAMAFATAIGAATENVVDHAKSSIGALVAAQRYEATGLELAVVDLGLGIPTTLGENPSYADLTDLEAIERALEDGVSSVQEEGRGTGLWELVETVGKAKASTLGIGSGRGDLRLSWRNGGRTRNAATPGHEIPGTWISIRLEG